MVNIPNKPMCEGYANCLKCDMRDIALFAELSAPDLGLITHPISKYTFEPGAFIYRAGEVRESIYTVRHGVVKLVYFGPDGSQRIVRLLRAGSVAGIEALAGKPYEQTAIALKESSVCQIAIEDVNRLDRETSHLHRQLLERWCTSVRDANHWIIFMSTGEAKARVARLFLYLAGAENECTLFSREDAGAVLGLSPETVIRIITDFREAGIIRKLKLNHYQCDIEALRDVAGYEVGCSTAGQTLQLDFQN